MPLPLEGLLVVSLEQAVAAPTCACRLADAGARVIKIERPEGDFARYYDKVASGESAYFVWLNRGKQSVVLDLTDARDKALLDAMLTKADVFIQNLKPGAIAKLGFAVERLRRAYPRLIVCSISGYGETGPYAHRKAYDLLIQAEAGLASVTGGPEAPARVGVSIVDVAAGLNAYQAILEALHGHKDLGIHSGMICDGMVPLIENGVANGARKTQCIWTHERSRSGRMRFSADRYDSRMSLSEAANNAWSMGR